MKNLVGTEMVRIRDVSVSVPTFIKNLVGTEMFRIRDVFRTHCLELPMPATQAEGGLSDSRKVYVTEKA
jgi:hypothetical protein